MHKLSIVAITIMATLTACDGDGPSPPILPPPPPPLLVSPVVNVDVGIKQLIFSWADVPGATHYRLLENSDGNSGFTQVGANIASGVLSVRRYIAVHHFDFSNALFILEACNTSGCTGSVEVNAMNGMMAAIAYVKAASTDVPQCLQNNCEPELGDRFGNVVALSGDGMTLAVGAYRDDSNATGVNGDFDNNSASDAGAVYLFRNDGSNWSQHAYIKASNSEGDDPLIPGDVEGDEFGRAIALSADGNTLAVGAPLEDSAASGLGGDQSDNTANGAGAVYIYRYVNADWVQEAYLKASNTEAGDEFGASVDLSDDGNTLVVGAVGESSDVTGINGDQSNNSAPSAGSAYLFRFDGTDWSQSSYVKASNAAPGDEFGLDVALSGDGTALAVSAGSEDSNATGINGDQSDNSVESAGAVYLFRFDGTGWNQQAYVKASNTDTVDVFGGAIALNVYGTILAVGAMNENSNATGINGNQTDNSCFVCGAAYVFRFDGTDWFQDAYIKASNTEESDRFGSDVSLNSDGTLLAVGALWEDGMAAGVDGDQFADTGLHIDPGATYLFSYDGATWSQIAYVKATNPEGNSSPFQGDEFGGSVSLSADGNALAVGAQGEDSGATGINGDQGDSSVPGAGAAYLY